MRKDRIPAQNARDNRIGGPRKLRCIHCRSEYALPVRSGKKMVFECPKCHTQYDFKNI